MKNSKNKITVFALIAATCISLAGAFALFTDYKSAETKAKAGNVKVVLSEPELENHQNINPGDEDPAILEKFIPKDGEPLYDPANPTKEYARRVEDGKVVSSTNHKFSFVVSNDSNKSIRTRQTIVISALNKNKEILDPSVFKLLSRDEKTYREELGSKAVLGEKYYVLKDSTEITDEEYDLLVKENKKPEVIAIKYLSTPNIFDGKGTSIENGGDAEKEDVNKIGPNLVQEKDGSVSKLYEYNFVMSYEATNGYQAADVKIDVIVEGLQYRNTTNQEWKTIAVKTISAGTSGVVIGE